MKILVAEDDHLSRRIVCRAVEALGHEAIPAEDGVTAWEHFLQERPEVVISDWQMPGCTGPELCRRIREVGGRYTYLVLLTSHSDHERRLEGMGAGADDYLGKPFDPLALELKLIAAARLVGLHRQIESQRAELHRLNDRLFEEGRRCALTGVANRLQLEEDLRRLHALRIRHERHYCLAMFDVDDFKSYNDTAGHVAGDHVLELVARTMEREARTTDRVYRYGGEEFIAVFELESLDGACAAAERMRASVEKVAIAHPGRGGIVTVSCGVARTGELPSVRPHELIERADRALYQAKREGKNRVIRAEIVRVQPRPDEVV